jgi:hypothetical protein
MQAHESGSARSLERPHGNGRRLLGAAGPWHGAREEQAESDQLAFHFESAGGWGTPIVATTDA